MTTIRIYDCDARELDKIANENDISIADVVEEMVAEYLQGIKDAKKDKIGKPEAFYTGGGIWISAMYLDENTYCTTDNCDYDDCLVYYDHRDEDQDSEFPCQSQTGFKEQTEFSDDDWEIYKKLRAELEKQMR